MAWVKMIFKAPIWHQRKYKSLKVGPATNCYDPCQISVLFFSGLGIPVWSYLKAHQLLLKWLPLNVLEEFLCTHWPNRPDPIRFELLNSPVASLSWLYDTLGNFSSLFPLSSLSMSLALLNAKSSWILTSVV